MDKELLEALNNLSLSLDEISKALKKESTSAVSSALKGGNFSKSLESISKEIVQISKDTTQIKKDQSEIIKSQNTIINMLSDIKSDRGLEVEKKVTSPTTVKEVGKSKEEESKQSESKSLFGGASKDSSKIKDGVATIVLIAAGVLAIGMAFKIIGNIDIASVLTLSLALPMIAFAFQKISEMKLKASEIGGLVLLTVGMSTAIALSSFILATVRPFDISQALTAILIAGVFTGISFGMSRTINSIKDLGIGGAAAVGISFLLPILMVGFSAAIAGSSYFLGMVRPIGPFQGISAILISGVFVGLSYSLGKIISSMVGINPATALVASLVAPIILVALSAAIAGASVVLGQVKPIGIFQALTAILIAGVFATISWGLNKLLTAFRGVGPGTILAAAIGLPIILVAMSYAIAASSSYFSAVKPIGIFQALSAILIAGVFTVLGFGIGKMLQGFRGVDPGTAAVAAITIPIIMIALTYAIKVGSEWLSQVKPIGFFQFLTAIGISIVFVALSYAVKPLMKGVQGVGLTDIAKGILVLMALTAAIVAGSYLMAETKVISLAQGLSFIGTAVALGIASLVIGFALKKLDKMGTMKEYLGGALALTLISTTIMVSSHILALGDYSKFPSLYWTIGVVAAMIPFGIGMYLIGSFAATGAGALVLLAGGLSMMGIALTIVGVSHILKLGDYSIYPPISWTVGVVAAMVPFGLGMAVLGLLLPLIGLGVGSVLLVSKTIAWTAEILKGVDFSIYPPISWTVGVVAAMVPFGLGMVTLGPLLPLIGLGVGSVLLVAKTITWTADILKGGQYTNYPSLGWSLGTSIALGAFASGMALLGGIIFATFGVGGLMLAAGSAAVLGVAKTIVSASDILANGYEEGGKKFTPNYSGGPTKNWAEGIAIALGAFSPIYSMLMKNSILSLFGMGGVGPEDFTKAIKTVSQGIVSAASFFASPENPGIWAGYPTKKWAEGVGIAISAFSPVYRILADNTGIFKSGISVKNFVDAIRTVSEGIVSAAKFFAENKSPFEEGNYPSKKWGEGVGAALGAFAPVFEILSGSNNMWVSRKSISAKDLAEAIKSIATSIVEVSEILKGGTFDAKSAPSAGWSQGVKSSLEAFGAIFGFINDNKGWFGADVSEVSSAILQIGTSIATVSKKLSGGKFDIKIDPNWINSVRSTIDGYILIMKKLKNFDIDDFEESRKKLDLIISTISSISNRLSSLKLPNVSIQEWVDQARNSIQIFANLIINISKTISKESILSGKSIIMLILTSISQISSYFDRIKYSSNLPTKEWLELISSTLNKMSNIILTIGSYSKDILRNGVNNTMIILRGFKSFGDLISKMIYPPLPNNKWVDGVELLIQKIGKLMLSVGSYEKDALKGGVSNSIVILRGVRSFGDLISKMVYPPLPDNKWINGVDLLIRKMGNLLNFVGLSYEIGNLIVGRINMKMILGTLKDVADRLSKIVYGNPPTSAWVSRVESTVKRIGSLLNFVGENISIVGVMTSRFKLGQIISVISNISKQFSVLSFDKSPSESWSKNILKSTISISALMNYVDENISLFGIRTSSEKMIEIGKLIFIIGGIFSKMEFKKIDTDWSSSMSSLFLVFSSSIIGLSKISKSEFESGKSYLFSIADMVKDIPAKFAKINMSSETIKKVNSISDLFKSMGNLIKVDAKGVTDLDRISTSFDKLSKSIDNFGTSLNNINSEKLSQIASMKSGSILINLVSEDQFNQLIEQIEKRSDMFGEAVSNMKKNETPTVKVASESVTAVKVESPEQNQSQDIQAQILLALKDIQEVLGRGKTLDNYVKEKTGLGSLVIKK